MLFKRAVAVTILVPGDSADWRNEIDPFRRLEIAAQLDDEHAAVAVERDLRGILDERFRQQRLDPIARLQPQSLRLFCRRQRLNRRLRRQVGGGVRGIVRVGRRAGSSPAARRLNCSPGDVLGVGDEGKGGEYEDSQGKRGCDAANK
jgi:hypothetical protein